MKSHIYKLIGFFVIYSVLVGCTYADFPISFDSALPDRRMEGIWTTDGADFVYEIKVMQDGKAYALRHTFDRQKQKLVREPQYPRLYFYNILTSDSKKYSFASIMNGGKYYSTVNYSFINNDAVRLLEVQYSAAKERYQEKDGYYKFGTMENHRNYITDNLLTPGNYSSESVLKRVTDLSALEYKIGQELKKAERIKAEQLAAQTKKEAVKKPEPTAANYPLKKPETLNSPSSETQQQPSRQTASTQYFDTDRSYQTAVNYSYYDVYHIQKSIPNNNCIQAMEKIGGGHVIYGKKPVTVPSYDQDGKLQLDVEMRETKETTGTYNFQQYDNTCAYEATLKGIRKYKNSSGNVLFQDASLTLDANSLRDLDETKFVEYYDPQKADFGVTVYYRNNLSIDKNTYNRYLKSVAESSRGTVSINSYSSRTRVYLNAGDRIIIKASGSIYVDGLRKEVNPDGIEANRAYGYDREFKVGALLYRIAPADWTYLGANAEIVAERSGIFRLTPNVQNPYRCSGEYAVHYEIIRAGR